MLVSVTEAEIGGVISSIKSINQEVCQVQTSFSDTFFCLRVPLNFEITLVVVQVLRINRIYVNIGSVRP